MRLGISSYTYVWAVGVPGYSRPAEPMTALHLLDKASTLGVRVVQVGDNLPLHALPDEELASFGRRAHELGIDVEVGPRGIETSHIADYIDIAKRLRSSILRVVVDTEADRPRPDEISRRLTGLMPDLARTGITLAIENHDRFSAEVLRRIVHDLDSEHVGICFDTANSIGCLESPEYVLEVLGSYIVNLHIKDFRIRRPLHHKGFVVEGRAAGKGQLDLPRLLARIEELGREMSAILELWPPPEATIEAAVEKEDRWARESIEYLRHFISE